MLTESRQHRWDCQVITTVKLLKIVVTTKGKVDQKRIKK